MRDVHNLYGKFTQLYWKTQKTASTKGQEKHPHAGQLNNTARIPIYPMSAAPQLHRKSQQVFLFFK